MGFGKGSQFFLADFVLFPYGYLSKVWVLPERGRGVVKAPQDGLEHFFSHLPV